MKCPGCGRQFGAAAADQFAQCPVCNASWASAGAGPEAPAAPSQGSAGGAPFGGAAPSAVTVLDSVSTPGTTPSGFAGGAPASSEIDPWATSSAAAAVTIHRPAVPRPGGGVLRPAPAKRSTWLQPVKVVGAVIGLVAASFLVGGLVGAGVAVVLPGDDSTGVAAKDATGTSTSAVPASSSGPGTARTAQINLRDTLTAEKVYFIDNLVYTDDLGALAEILEGEDVPLGSGLTVPEGRSVNVAIGEQGAVVCLTANSTGGPFVLAAHEFSDSPTRFAREPMARCDRAAFEALPGDSW